jgi:lipopolysaccharide/colanic/teichoic acid biosynthesis glycosyltransferase
VSGLVLVVTAPVMAVLALIIVLESRGGPILAQERVGKGGRTFRCLKLRSMSSRAVELQPQLETLNEADGPIFKMRSDPRVTRVGRLMRRLSLDELPQMWNVFSGEMSLVGPRPPLPSEVARYDAWHRRRLEVKPGLTGIWQVSGRSDLPFDEMAMMDIYYIDNWSVALDVKILIRTFIAVLRGQGAY